MVSTRPGVRVAWGRRIHLLLISVSWVSVSDPLEGSIQTPTVLGGWGSNCAVSGRNSSLGHHKVSSRFDPEYSDN